MREYHYRVDREGRIFHDGSEIVDPLVLRFFLRAMTRTPEGRYLVVCQGEHNWFEADGTPFVVQRLRLSVEEGDPAAVELCFAGDYREPLDPESLEAGSGSLCCRVRRGTFQARFGRLAIQQLAPFLVDDGTGPGLLLGGARHPIREVRREIPGATSLLADAPGGATSLVLVRHGETAGNRGRRFQTYDTPLSEIGRAQAARVAERLAGGPRIHALYTSDLARALETASIIGNRAGLAPISSPALRELDVGDWKGRLHAEMEAACPGGFEGWIAGGGAPRLPGPEGEGLGDAVERAVPCLEAVAARHRGERVVLVSHGLTLGILLAHAHGWDQREAFGARRVTLLNTAVSEVEWLGAGTFRCPLVGCTAHLDAELRGAGSGIGAA